MPPDDRWNDQAIDGLDKRVDDVADEVTAMRDIPANVARQVVKLEQAVASLLEAQREEREVSRSFRKDIHEKVDGIGRSLAAIKTEVTNVKADLVGVKTGQDRQPGKAWLAVMVAVITVIGVIAAALITAYAQIKAGAP